MWHISRLLVASLAAVATAATDGSIFIFDSETANAQTHASVNEDSAQILLQQRMRSTDFAASAVLDESALELLNSYGGEQNSLFDEPHSSQEKLLVIIEGLTKETGAIQPSTSSSLRIPRVSSDSLGTSMLESILTSESKSVWSQKQCTYEAATDAKLQVSSSRELQACLNRYMGGAALSTSHAETLARLPSFSVDSWHNNDDNRGILKMTFKKETKDQTAVEKFINLASELFNAPEQTYLLLPEVSSNRPSRNDNKFIGKRSTLVDKTVRAPKGSDLPSALLPVCYASNSSCSSSTKDCSGHGSCYLKSGSKKDDECFACRCGQTKVENADGSIRTVQWGGAACQKQDISIPFFLLASITILAILAVGAGISMLFSVGQQELPSVINAGVNAPKGGAN
ncbi:uncharacterized protein TRUGW13939_01062 [Talaromyces rugulosus]|uniref:Vacuolar sorting protein Vps3844 C-terminal domain-containing protein n=1 Tax=Talaromyces rugulosus TaxID=121627 RepID=A0A7H8QJY3_TALRU|nr:uncharacterized protein TRUGW13939_01062 [Talaromyces rugulosus]QKX53982.1 hypothetical protein TRUGW13939_01062 [Talaromyces rugulosus]